ncbi:MAG TPA: hypothetical protein VGL06_23195 [Pseudonocardiaceae bacterium]
MVLEPVTAALGELIDLVRDARCTALGQMRGDLAEQRVERFEEFAREFTGSADVCREVAAWCRLMAALLRGEDVPLSVYPGEGEDPVDTARWKKWRVS